MYTVVFWLCSNTYFFTFPHFVYSKMASFLGVFSDPTLLFYHYTAGCTTKRDTVLSLVVMSHAGNARACAVHKGRII